MNRRHASLVVAVLLLAGACSGVPNMDSTGSGCANQAGNGPSEAGDPAGIPLEGIAGLTPVEVVVAANAAGHVVVFRQDHLHCACVAPAGYGPVSEGWWGSRGQLYIDLEGVVPQGVMLDDGAGCRWSPLR